MSVASEPFKLLDWDSAFWGRRIARLVQVQRSHAELTAVLKLAREARVECLYYLLDANDALAARAVAGTAFNMVDVRLTLSLATLPEQKECAGVRLSEPTDVPQLRAIAASSHGDTRFYFDGRFPREKCDELYAAWIEKSVAGALADAVLVSFWGSRVTGYVTCSVKAEHVGEIGLIAVDAAERGRGLGTTLVDSALHWFCSRGCQSARVVTQGRNLGAQRLYQRSGFVPTQSDVWYHAWLDPA